LSWHLECWKRTPSPVSRSRSCSAGRGYNLARWLTRNETDAEDLVQEAFLRAFKAFPGFRGTDARAWLLAIVRNACYTWLRRTRAQKVTTAFDEEIHTVDGDVLNPERLVLQEADRTRVRQALEELPVEFREVLVLREIEGLSYKEIATVADIPVGTVMSRLARARGACSMGWPARRTRSDEMSCQETRSLLHAFLDDELDLTHILDVQHHLDTCPACARELAAQRTLRAALRTRRSTSGPRWLHGTRPRRPARDGCVGRPRGSGGNDGALPLDAPVWLPAGAAAALLAVVAITIWRLGPGAPGRPRMASWPRR